ncbi:hypothetical protein K8942_00575 [Candidatus Peribacteria bacterium]|nr:MAG: hypothetical protein K8942_00575 [Candidatus Peribacteria bacterium]
MRSFVSLPWKRALAAASAVAVVASQTAMAASSWAPTLLVNTESFQTIDEGDGSTNIVIRFGQTLLETITYDRTLNRFQFSKGISVLGTMSGSALRVDRNADIWGNLSASGSVKAEGGFTGTTLRLSGPADIQGGTNGTLTASGAIRTGGDITINSKNTSNDAVLNFGNATQAQTLKFLNGAQKFEFSKGLNVKGTLSGAALTVNGNANIGGALTATGSIRTKGNLSGSTLTVDGNLTLHGVTYNAPSTQGGANTFLKNDGAGNLTWANAAVGNGSGNIMSLHPEYPNAVYFSSGSTYIGQLTASGGTSSLENAYVWTSSKVAANDYWISTRVRLPDNFSTWDAVKPIEFRYKTGVASAANNYLTVKMRDTAGAVVNLTNGGNLANTSWTTASITGPQAGGTWTPKGYFTIYIKLAANNTAGANAAAGFLNLNIETTTP